MSRCWRAGDGDTDSLSDPQTIMDVESLLTLKFLVSCSPPRADASIRTLAAGGAPQRLHVQSP